MPCNSDYMEADRKEIELSRVACLLDEIAGKPEIDRSHWAGYHPKVYCKAEKVDANGMVSTLCKILQDSDVSKYSLEMQIWWRDHKKADKQRVESEIEEKKREEDRQSAIEKLSPYECSLLNV